MLKFEKLTNDIYLLRTPLDSIFTGVFLVTGEENVLIDSGVSGDGIDNIVVPALEDLGLKITDIAYMMNTHNHGDHVNGDRRVLELSGAKLVAFDEQCAKFLDPLFYSKKTRAQFPGYSPKAPDFLPNLIPDVVLHEGSVLAGHLHVFTAPGHDTECIMILDDRTNSLITGDSLQFAGIVNTPNPETGYAGGVDVAFYKDLAGYKATIEKACGIDPDNLFASHPYYPDNGLYYGKAEVTRGLDICRKAVADIDACVKGLIADGTIKADPNDLTQVAIAARALIKMVGGTEPTFIMESMYTAQLHM